MEIYVVFESLLQQYPSEIIYVGTDENIAKELYMKKYEDVYITCEVWKDGGFIEERCW